MYPAQNTEEAASAESTFIDEERVDADGQASLPDIINLEKHFSERGPLYVFLERVNLQCPFVYPATLLGTLPKHKSAGALIHAMSALGGAVSGNANLASQAYDTEERLFKDLGLKAFVEPNTTSIKVLLCLSFLQLGKGNNSGGWMISGTSDFP